MGVLKIIMVAYQRVIPLRIAVDSFLNQSDPNWELYIVHDGPPPEEIKELMVRRQDARIHFRCTPNQNGCWGHRNRAAVLQQLEFNENDFVLMTNDDNYYVPSYVGMVREQVVPGVGMVYYNTLHNYWNYIVHQSRLKEGGIDMGAFIVRGSIARAVGFNHINITADGRYCEECAAYCQAHNMRIVYIPGVVPFVHN